MLVHTFCCTSGGSPREVNAGSTVKQCGGIAVRVRQGGIHVVVARRKPEGAYHMGVPPVSGGLKLKDKTCRRDDCAGGFLGTPELSAHRARASKVDYQ